MNGKWILTDPDGTILARFGTEDEAREATYTGEYPDEVEVAYEDEWVVGEGD